MVEKGTPHVLPPLSPWGYIYLLPRHPSGTNYVVGLLGLESILFCLMTFHALHFYYGSLALVSSGRQPLAPSRFISPISSPPSQGKERGARA
ncbi:hypothetical protein K437DRAFT_67617 [Tilletiaria anomala UBC 951]|uniref:Uncharacterized protein n=1 Tax=Tilletiaria anomala (strain ATCC 24038 / CBS 436.72 / UBC 951) TaxID=1037660 RepID=A0A066V373_TILAU|nr:uncharacterized protein K437DRAFT_67617 [Tilletiaria anomala UBC 951]KDN35851.1 hypothetical protein K437DRAFT_67617 [Tilletiaria anomala UBC 951]